MVELVGGSGPHEGNVIINGQPVCDDGSFEYGTQNAQVVCRFGNLYHKRGSSIIFTCQTEQFLDLRIIFTSLQNNFWQSLNFHNKSSHFLQIQSPSYYQINVMAKSIFHPRMLGYTGGDYTVESHFGQVSDVFGMDEVQCTGDEDYIWRCPHESTDDCSGGEGFGVICYNGGRNFLLNTSQITRQPDHKMIFLSTKSEQNFNV